MKFNKILLSLAATGISITFVLLLHWRYQVLDVKKMLKEYREWIATPISQIYQFDDHLGWVARPNQSYILRTYHNYHVQTDSNGWRKSCSFDQADVIVIGDSFSFGIGVEPEQHFQHLNQDIDVKAIGLPGYNLVQEYLLLERHQEEMQNKLIIWLLFYGNDFYETIQANMMKYTTPYLKQKENKWKIIQAHLTQEYVPYLMDKHFMNYYGHLGLICSEEQQMNLKMMSAIKYLFTSIRKICKDVNSKLVVVGVPDVNQMTNFGKEKLDDHLKQLLPKSNYEIDVSLPDKRLISMFKTLDIQFIPGSKFLVQDDYAQDLHWNPQGHAKVANLIRELMKVHSKID